MGGKDKDKDKDKYKDKDKALGRKAYALTSGATPYTYTPLSSHHSAVAPIHTTRQVV